MTSRDVTNFRTVIGQVVENQDQTADVLANIGTAIVKTNQEAKMAENFSRAQLELNQLDMEYQVNFAHDPFGGLDNLKQSRKEIFDKHGDEISPFFRGTWNENTRNLAFKNDAMTEAWAFGQTRKNTVGSINRSIENNMNQAIIDGQNFGNLDTDELGSMVNYTESKDKLVKFGDANLGEAATTNLLETYDEDYLKSFLGGVIETNPVKALKFLNEDNVKNNVGAKDLAVLRKSARNRVLNFDKTRSEREILEVMTGEDGLYQASLERDLSTVELERAYRKNKTPETVQRVLNKMNGYGGVTKKLSNAEKVSNRIEMFDLLASMETAENIEPIKLLK